MTEATSQYLNETPRPTEHVAFVEAVKALRKIAKNDRRYPPTSPCECNICIATRALENIETLVPAAKE